MGVTKRNPVISPYVEQFVDEIVSPSRKPARRRGQAHAEVVSAAQLLLRRIITTNGLVRGLAETHFATYGLSMAQWGVLRTLSRLETQGVGSPTLSELGRDMVVRPPSLSATVERMVKSGLVIRRRDPIDRRARRIELAAKGRKLLERRLPDHRMWVEGVLAGLDRREQEQLSQLLAKAGAHMRELASPSRVNGSSAPASQQTVEEDVP